MMAWGGLLFLVELLPGAAGEGWLSVVHAAEQAHSGPANQPTSQPANRRPDAYRAGWQALRAGDPARAIAVLEPALPHLRVPSHAALLLFLARCQQGQFDAALRELCAAREKYRERRFADSLVAYYTHRLTETHLRRRARTPQEKSELAFYLGAYRQDYEGDSPAAYRLYRRCVSLAQTNTPEYALARSELARRRPGHTAPHAARRWQPATLPGAPVRLYHPPDWTPDPAEDFLALVSQDGRTQIMVSRWAGGAEVLPSLELTAKQNGMTVERSGRADLRWAGLSAEAWFVEGRPAHRDVRQTILALQRDIGFLLFLFESPPSDYLWQRATFDLMLQGLGNSPPAFGRPGR
jgi:hypothetical protein